MSRSWRQHPAAAELRDAVLYLEEVREGLGERFLDAVNTALRSILDDSAIGPTVSVSRFAVSLLRPTRGLAARIRRPLASAT